MSRRRELVEKYNEEIKKCDTDFYNEHSETIKATIKDRMNSNYVTYLKNIKDIPNNIEKGFYIIISTYKASKDEKELLKFIDNGKTFYFLFLDEDEDVRKGILKNLFFDKHMDNINENIFSLNDPGVSAESDFYINLDKKKAYSVNGYQRIKSDKLDEVFDAEWGFININLYNTNPRFRKLYKRAFIELYTKPYFIKE